MERRLPIKAYQEAQTAESSGKLEMAMGLYAEATYFHQAARVALRLDRPDEAMRIYTEARDLYSVQSVLRKFGVKCLQLDPPEFTESGRQLTYDQFMPDLECRIHPPNDIDAMSQIREIEWFPDGIQRVAHKHGLKGIFYNGPIVNVPEAASLKGEKTGHPSGLLYDNCDGMYDPSLKLFIARPIHGTAFHEYAHGVNHLVGLELFGRLLSDRHEIRREFRKIKDRLNPLLYYNSSEFMTYAMRLFFGRDYKGRKTGRVKYKKDFPKTAHLLEIVENETAVDITVRRKIWLRAHLFGAFK